MFIENGDSIMSMMQLKMAVQLNKVDLVKSLLKEKQESKNLDLNLVEASKLGFIEIVKLFLNDKRVDPTFDHSCSIELSSKYGHLEVVKLLLNDNRVDLDNNSFVLAAEWGHFDIISLFLDLNLINPSEKNNQSIYLAAENGHTDIVKLLWSDERIKDSLCKDWNKLYHKLKADDVQKKLNKF
jgi:hypothetical protein